MTSRTMLVACLASLVLCAALAEGRGGGGRGREDGEREGDRDGRGEGRSGEGGRREGGRGREGGRSGERGRRGGAAPCSITDVVNDASEVLRVCPPFTVCEPELTISSQDGATELYIISFCKFDQDTFAENVECEATEDNSCATFQVGGNEVSLPVDENGAIITRELRPRRPVPTTTAAPEEIPQQIQE